MPTHLIIIKCHAAFLTALHQAIVFSHPHCHFHFLLTNDNIKQVPKWSSCHAIFLAAMLPPSSSSCSSSAQHCEVPRPTFTFFSLSVHRNPPPPPRDRGRRYSGKIINNQYIWIFWIIDINISFWPSQWLENPTMFSASFHKKLIFLCPLGFRISPIHDDINQNWKSVCVHDGENCYDEDWGYLWWYWQPGCIGNDSPWGTPGTAQPREPCWGADVIKNNNSAIDR